MAKFLRHNRLFIRVGATIAFTLGLLVIIWVLSYLLLPQGLVKISFTASLIPSSPFTIAAQIFGLNLLLGAFDLMLMNQWHDAGGLALGYYIHFLRSAVFHGLLRGTNSFAFPYNSQAELIFGFFKVGLWETLAFCLICAATAAFAAFPVSSAEGIRAFFTILAKPQQIKRDVFIAFIVGVLMLGFSAIMEALNIING